MAAPGPSPTTLSKPIPSAFAALFSPATRCSSAAPPPSTRSRPPSPSSKMMKPSTPAAAPSSRAMAKSSSTHCSWMAEYRNHARRWRGLRRTAAQSHPRRASGPREESPRLLRRPDAENFAAEHGMPLIDNAELVLDRERRAARRRRNTKSVPACPTRPSRAFRKRQGSSRPRLTRHRIRRVVTRHRRRRRARCRRQSRRRHLHRRHAEQGARPRRRLLAHRLRLLRGQSQRRRLAHRMGRAHHETRARQVGRRSRPRRRCSRRRRAEAAIAYLFRRLGGHGGIILLGPDGRYGLAHNTPRMAWGVCNQRGVQVGIKA